MGALGKILIQLLFAAIPGITRAILERVMAKKAAAPQTAPEAVLEVAKQEAEVQHDINQINSQPLAVDDAVERLRQRAAAAYPADGSGA